MPGYCAVHSNFINFFFNNWQCSILARVTPVLHSFSSVLHYMPLARKFYPMVLAIDYSVDFILL